MLKLTPGKTCIFCGETKGQKIVAQKIRGMMVTKERNNGIKNHRIEITKGGQTEIYYFSYWGFEDKMSSEIIDRAKQLIQNLKHPWFCQKCGKRICSICGEPINYPVGSDIIFESGCTTHIPIIPADLGCINQKCKKYRKFDWFKSKI